MAHRLRWLKIVLVLILLALALGSWGWKSGRGAEMAHNDITVRDYLSFALNGVVGVGQGSAEGAPAVLQRIDAGKLVLPTGRICVTDAYSPDEWPALNVLVPSGSYPVQLVIADIAKTNRQTMCGKRFAFMLVTFTEEPVERWSPMTAVKSADPCFTDEAPHALVQEGMTAVTSPEAADAHFAAYRRDETLPDRLRERHQRIEYSHWLNYVPGEEPANMIMCEGGFGDGTLYCFGGFTRQGRLARLVVDFAVAVPVAAANGADATTAPVN